jgi:CRP-like cAMP-binding protein
MSEETFQGQVLDLIEEVVQQPLPAAEPALAATGSEERPVRTRGVAESAQRLLASPLFRELSEAELLAVVRGMRLHTYEAGDIVITEGERGDSLFIVTSGGVRTFVRNPAGHNFEMGVLEEGSFFGELSSLSGRPRGSTIVAAGHAELLELGKKAVDEIARTHPHVRETLESVYIERASSPEAAAIRAVPVDPASRQRAIEVLEAYFGESRWDPRMRLRLADLLVKAGKQDDAVPLLVGLADDLDRAGFPDKAIAILKKIEKIRRRSVEEVNLAPLKKKRAQAPEPSKPTAPLEAAPARPARPLGGRHQTVESFSNWMVDVVRDAVAPPMPSVPLPPTVAPGYARGLLASPLFQGLTEDELYTMIRELRLLSFDPGDIVITEGEPGQSLFILTAGSVKVSVRNAQGRSVRLAELRAGSFFGEMATVSGKPRSATVTAAQRCELLELDKPAIDQIAARHPRVREVLEEIYVARATSPEALRARTGAPPA